MSESEVAWAAGLFEGEGTVFYSLKSGYSVSLASTDLDVVERFAAVVGFGRVSDARRPSGATSKSHWRDVYEWRATRRAHVEQLHALIGDYLGNRRTAKFEEVLAQEVRGRARVSLTPGD
jgi:hypothetical protein